ncbi:MAG: DUF4293 family protein [Muribaculaceae bacterium]|nr:DUF4293 family protein [Muribaculaceae bacterium]MBQ2563845.1 DUF4293 family protein [Muribaculaceae bacterium]MBQ5408342.1 DUF4293 family protein [Muribaculaceae bacterium]MDY6412484.1 DUF4293 family protein [Bacteroidales bacterium]
MVIQRKQSLYLLIVAILMGIFAFMPTLMDANGKVILGGFGQGIDLIPFMLNCLVSLLAFITIFKFKNLKLQKSLTVVGVLLVVASLATICLIALFVKNCDIMDSITYYNVLPVIAIIFLLLAHKGISHDQKLLSGSSRIR